MDEKEQDALELFLEERLNTLVQELTKEIRENREVERYVELEALVMEHYSEDKEKCKEFMDWIASQDGQIEEDLYLHGIRDGIRAAKQFLSI